MSKEYNDRWTKPLRERRPTSVEELAALIPAEQARTIVAKALIAAGADGPDWDSLTIEHVLNPFLPLVQKLMGEGMITDPFNYHSAADLNFWRKLAGVDEEEEDRDLGADGTTCGECEALTFTDDEGNCEECGESKL